MTNPSGVDMDEIAFGIIAYAARAQRESRLVKVGKAHIFEPYVHGLAKHMLALGGNAR